MRSLRPAAMRMVGSAGIPGFPGLPAPDDVRALQDSVARNALVIDNAASSCSALDVATFQSWRLTGYVPAQQYAQEQVPSFGNPIGLFQMWMAGHDMLQTLEGWSKQIASKGCTVPIVTVPGPYADLISAAKWVGGVAVFLALVGLAYKALSVIETTEKVIP